MAITDYIFGMLGYQRRLTGGVSTSGQTFDNSDIYDVSFGQGLLNDTGNVEKYNKIVWHTYKTNPLLFGAVEMVIRMTLSNDVKPVATNLNSDDATQRANAEKLQVFLDSFWGGQENNMQVTCQEIARELILFGEVIPVFSVDSAGNVSVGFLQPSQIKELKRAVGSMRKIESIVARPNGIEDKTFYIVTRRDLPSKEDAERYVGVSPANLAGRLRGDCYYWSLNRALTQERGVGDFVQAIDSCRQIARLSNSIVNRTQMNNCVVSKVTFPESWDQTKINQMTDAKNPNGIKIPTASNTNAQVFAASQGIDFVFITPQIPATENASIANGLYGLFSAGTGLPMNWITGQTEATAKASAENTSTPTFGYLKNRQSVFEGCYRDIVNYAIDQNTIYLNELRSIPKEELYSYKFTGLPDINVKDDVQKATVMNQLINVISAAKMIGGLSEEEAAEYCKQVISMGFDS
jgi:hypothetical protein